MPPLTTPPMAIVFMAVFFLTMIGIPRMFLHKHHAAK